MAADPRDKFFETAHITDSVEASAVRGGRFVAMAQVVRSLLDVVATLVLVRLLLPGEFGLVGMVTAVIGFAGLFKDLGLSAVTVQREDIGHRHVSALFWINVALSSVLLVIVAAASPAIAWFYAEPQLTQIGLALSATMLLGGHANQHVAILRRQMRFRALAIIETTSIAIGMVVAIGSAFEGVGYWALVFRSLASGAVTVVGSWLACGWRPSPPRGVEGLREMIVFGADLTGFSVINYFARNLDDVLIGRFTNADTLGQYQKAYNLLMLPLRRLNTPVTAVAVPTLSRLQNEPERYRMVYLRIVRLVILLSMPLAAYLILTADELVLVVFGEHWKEAGRLFGVLGIAALTQPLTNSTGWLFISQGRTREMLRWGIFGAVTAIVAFIAGLPWGAYGVAVAYVGSGLLIRTPALLWYVGRSGPVSTRDFYVTAAPFALSAIAVAAALIGIRRVLPIESAPLLVASHALVAIIVAAITSALTATGRGTIRDAHALVTKRFTPE